MKAKWAKRTVVMLAGLLFLVLCGKGGRVASAAEPKTTYRWMDPVSVEMLGEWETMAPRLNGVDEEKAEALLEELCRTTMPERYATYLKSRKEGKEYAEKLKKLFPEGIQSDPMGGKLWAEMLGRTQGVVGIAFLRRDSLCFFVILKEAGVFTAQELSKFDRMHRSFPVGPEGVDYPSEINVMELTLREEAVSFAEENFPKTLAAFRTLARLRSDGAESYNRIVQMAHAMDAVRVGEDLRILATRLREIKELLKDTDELLNKIRMIVAVKGASQEVLAKNDQELAQHLCELAKELSVRAYYLRKTKVAPLVKIASLGKGERAGEIRRIELPGGAAMEMVWCPPGIFMMGSPPKEPGRDEDEKRHSVALTKGFWIAKTEVTQKQWESIMGNNPSQFKGGYLPVEGVTWYECQQFCKKTGLSLPTEAQWEYACRARSTTALPNGDITILGKHNAPALDASAWYGGNSSVEWNGKNGTDTATWPGKQYPGGMAGTHLVGEKTPNAWGLHDMLGNVCEWCEDWYGKYTTSTPKAGDEEVLAKLSLDGDNKKMPGRLAIDPTGPKSGDKKVLRGGSWATGAAGCRSAYRGNASSNHRSPDVGFRPVKNVP